MDGNIFQLSNINNIKVALKLTRLGYTNEFPSGERKKYVSSSRMPGCFILENGVVTNKFWFQSISHQVDILDLVIDPNEKGIEIIFYSL